MELYFEQIEKVVELLRDTTYTDIKNIEGINVGSAHKKKDDIVNSVCKQARDARRRNQILHDCLGWLLLGKNISEFYSFKLEEATRKNQCKQDSDEMLEELALFTDLTASITI